MDILTNIHNLPSQFPALFQTTRNGGGFGGETDSLLVTSVLVTSVSFKINQNDFLHGRV
ncbi:Uncharacterised protein [Yersinia similis]|nr:Uncharacterised protein [Yersinia similis]